MTDHRKTAVYIRLSAEDDNVDGRAKKESDSVTSQRILLKSFVIDQLGVDEADILEYVDDGVSGTHFKRQGFQQLQDDMKSGEIGCVVVKDDCVIIEPTQKDLENQGFVAGSICF